MDSEIDRIHQLAIFPRIQIGVVMYHPNWNKTSQEKEYLVKSCLNIKRKPEKFNLSRQMM